MTEKFIYNNNEYVRVDGVWFFYNIDKYIPVENETLEIIYQEKFTK